MSGGVRPCGAPPGMGSVGDCAPSPGVGSGWPPPVATAYVVNSKIMVVAVAVLFAVVVFILCLHVYAKWYWRHQGAAAAARAAAGGHGQRRTRSWRRRRRREPGVLSPGDEAQAVVMVQSVGLEKAVVEALPMFEFVEGGNETAKAGGGALECAVCLEDFEPGEKGRTLPKCGHHFHLDCVDMWLFSHSTCPLCRAGVRPEEEESKRATVDTALRIPDHHPGPQSPPPPVIGDVQAPFMAAMRASRRQRQRSDPSQSLNSPTNATALIPPVDPAATPVTTTQTSTSPHEPPIHAPPTPAVDPKALAREYESISPSELPSNVLFWGVDEPSASSIRAPFHVTIDIPRPPANPNASVMSPMARASASFRRLLSRGKSVVSPHDEVDNDTNNHDNLDDEGGPSSHPPPPPPPPPPSNAL